ncbi:MAG: PAS-domain containing protein [Alphaproteobacteria bacterium]|nr:MAG: PAS-domain containing protein [Alphaproteobacteria bacterium]
MFFIFVMMLNIVLAVSVYRLYLYKMFYMKRDFAYVPDLSKSEIHLSPKLQNVFSAKPTFEAFIKYFFKDDVALLYKNISKKSFSFYITYNAILLKVEGFKVGQNGCVIEFYNLDTIKELNDHLRANCEKLQAQVDTFKFVLNHLPVIVCQKTKEGAIQYCNKLYAKFLDKTEQEVIKTQTVLELKNKTEYLTLKGKRRFFEVDELKKDEDQIIIGRDETERDKLKKEFDTYTHSTHNIFQQLSTPIAVFNSDQALTFFNKAYQMLFEFDAKFLGHQPLISEILDDLRNRQKIPEPQDFVNYKKVHRAFFNNLLEPFEETLHLPNGQVLRSVVSPQASGGVLYMYEDITNHLHLEMEHKSLSASQKEILDHLHEGVIIFGNDNRLRLSNPMLLKMFDLGELDAHMDDFIDKISTSLLTRQMILELFEKRTYATGKLSKEISWSYTPLPEGSHLLNFFYTLQKSA